MKKNSPTVFAIIPARGGSKGVIKKNSKCFGGHPLIAYSIIAAKLCPSIDRVIVSTDSVEITEIAKRYGAEVPFLRPEAYAQDHSPDLDFIKHALDWFDRHEKNEPDFLVHLRPTTPLRDPELLTEAIGRIKNCSEATSLRSVHELSEPPQKMFAINGDFLAGLYPEDHRPEYYNLPRQTFSPVYHPNGYVDVIRSRFVRESACLHGSRMLAFVTSTAVEIDRPADFEYLEYLIEKHTHLLCVYLENHFSERVL